MMDSPPSSVDHSPFSSPFQSPIISPASSRSTSPKSTRKHSQTPSPKIQLKRANSYRKNSKKGLSKLDDLIRRRGLLQRNRSQSDTDINDEEREREEEDRARMRRKKKSVSQDFTEKCKLRPNSTYSEKSYSTSQGGTPDRKKSLSQILDIRRLMDKSPKLPRNKSIRRAKTFSHVDDSDGDDANDGPLFQATTMFIPGYDFNTHQATPIDESTHLRNFLSRRGSKDGLVHTLLEKVQSSPNLMRRGSKDKLDKQAIDQVRNKSKYARSDSTPSTILKENGYTINRKNGSKSEQCINEYLSISERRAILTEKQKTFRDLKKPKNIEPESPNHLVARGNVKKISITFENGSIFSKNETEGSTGNAKSNTKRYSGDYDNIVRKRTESFETGALFNNQRSFDSDNLPIYSDSKNGNESGYASPTDSSLSETSAPPQINIVLQNTDYDDSWRRRARDWTHEYEEKDYLSPDVKLTNLCVTEL